MINLNEHRTINIRVKRIEKRTKKLEIILKIAIFIEDKIILNSIYNYMNLRKYPQSNSKDIGDNTVFNKNKEIETRSVSKSLEIKWLDGQG